MWNMGLEGWTYSTISVSSGNEKEAPCVKLLKNVKEKAVEGGPMYIGIVEDNTAVLEMLETTLTIYGHQVEKHSSASSFFAALQKSEPAPPYDLVITDLLLDRQSGTEIVDVLSIARPMTIPTLLVTAVAERLLVPIRERYPNLSIMRKPFKIQELIALLDQVKQRKPADCSATKGHAAEGRVHAGAPLAGYALPTVL